MIQPAYRKESMQVYFWKIFSKESIFCQVFSFQNFYKTYIFQFHISLYSNVINQIYLEVCFALKVKYRSFPYKIRKFKTMFLSSRGQSPKITFIIPKLILYKIVFYNIKWDMGNLDVLMRIFRRETAWYLLFQFFLWHSNSMP